MLRNWLRRRLGMDGGATLVLWDDHAVVGLPDGSTSLDAEIARRVVEDLLADRTKVVIFPYPVTVIDERTPR